MKLFEREYLSGMAQLLARSYRSAARAIRKGTIQTWLNDTVVIDGTMAYIQGIYNRVGVFYARKTLREINASAREQKQFGLDQEWIDAIIEYFRLYLLNKAVLPITDTTKADILAVLEKGVQEGWGVDRMAYELDRSDLPLKRARVIVRTELLKAQFEGRRLGADESEWETNKRWIAADDDRTRNSHRLMDDKIIRSDQKFAVPRRKGGFDMMEGPGDPEASAENVIQCRCTLVYRAARDENGRLIRKRKISVILPQELRRRQQRMVVTV